MKLDHTIVPCFDSKASAEFYADLLGMVYCGEYSHFIVVKVDSNLKLLFNSTATFEHHHYAFQASRQEYDAILNRIREREYLFGDGPTNRDNLKEYVRDKEKGFYFDDPDGHVLEVITTINT